MRDYTNVVIGSYSVTRDSRWKIPQNPPDPLAPSVILVTSVGFLGIDPMKPDASFALRMEIDCDDEYEMGPPDPYECSDLQEVTDFTPPR